MHFAHASRVLTPQTVVQALLLASGVVKLIGVKGGLAGGSMLYCVYIGSFYLATVAADERVQLYAALCGAVTGGVAGAVLFTAQGIFFTMTAQQISALSSPSSSTSTDVGVLPAVTSKLAGLFASIYLFCEVAFKLKLCPLGIDYWLFIGNHKSPPRVLEGKSRSSVSSNETESVR